jgi:hypothetical protein
MLSVPGWKSVAVPEAETVLSAFAHRREAIPECKEK